MFAGDVIEDARDWSPAFSREQFPDGPLLRRLGRIVEDLFTRAVVLNPDALAVHDPAIVEYSTITSALESRTPVEVPAFLTPIRALYRFADGRGVSPVACVTTTQATNRLCPFPAVVPLEAALRFVDLRDFGSKRSGWEDEGQLEFYYVPRPRAPTALKGEQGKLAAPEWMRGKISAELALWMAGRTGTVPPGLKDAAALAEEAFVGTVIAQQAGSSWYVHLGA